MPQSDTGRPSFFKVYGFGYQRLKDEPITISVETYKAIPDVETSNPSCNYLEVAEQEMLLGQTMMPASDLDLGYTNFSVATIAVYCRQEYQSIDFPDNPFFDGEMNPIST